MLFAALVVLAHVTQTHLSGLPALEEHTGHYVLPILVAAVVGVVVLSRILGELKPRS
jgi:hypothetical protein